MVELLQNIKLDTYTFILKMFYVNGNKDPYRILLM